MGGEGFLDGQDGTSFASGTSMAAPQAAGTAAYMWAVNPSLEVSEIVDLIKKTAREGSNGALSSQQCRSENPAPSIDTYDAVLAAGGDEARKALLDVTGDNRFDENDLEVFMDEWTERDGALDYSRYDLNGNGQTGGSTKGRFDLDQDIKFETTTRTIEDINKEFDERDLTDKEILCYYAYSKLYVGDKDKRFVILSGCGDSNTSALNGEAVTPSGESLSGMSVTLFGGNQEYSVTTDENGEFSQEVEPGTYEIRGNAVKDKTYLSVNRQQTSVSVQEGQTASITLDTEDGYYLDLRDVTLGGDQGTVTASPGESIDLSFDYTAWSRSELSTAIVYAAAGIGEEGQAAANLGIPGSNPGEDGSANLTLTVPSETGTYTVYVFEAPQTSESDALSQYENEFPNEDKFIPVATLEVTGGNSGTYTPGDGYEYFLSDAEYDAETDDIPALIDQEYGSDAELAEWNDLKDLYSDDKDGLLTFLNEIGATEKGQSWFVTRGGNQFYSGDRHYFLSRHEGDVPGNYLVHDSMHSNTVSLGSWYSTKQAIVRMPE